MALVACATASDQRSGELGARDAMYRSQGVVFGAEDTAKASEIAPLLGLRAPFWTPEEEDLDSFGRVVARYLRENRSRENDEILGNFANYRFQYFGVTWNEQKAILANAFCSRRWGRDTRWHTVPVVVLDGGPCYFRIVLSQESKNVLAFEVNGEG